MARTDTAGSNRLREGSLGLVSVAFMVISAAAPLTGVAGVVPIAFLMGNGTGVPATFLLATLVMLAFSVGYVAMSRDVRNAGAFYAFAARGLGGCWGGVVAFVALLSYNALQWGLIGLLGGLSATVFAGYGLHQPWWAWSLMAVLLVGWLGYRQVDVSARVLVALVVLEYAVVLVVDAAILEAGGAEGLTFDLFDAAAVSSGSLAAAVLFCLGCFTGFEATTIYAEEAREPDVTIPRATYLSVIVIGGFFVVTTWLMIVGIGADRLVPTLKSLPDPGRFFFDLADRYVGGPMSAIASLLLVSSLFAALSAFHNYIARYSYVAGREGLLPARFGRTHAVHQSPHVASVAQTVGALVVLAACAGVGLDPVLQLFTWVSQVGVLGVLGMMAVTSLAVVAHFRKAPGGSAVATAWMPAVAGLVMAVLFVYVFVRFGDLTGTQGAALGVILPALVPAAGCLGWFIASRLRATRPAAFAGMGASRS